MTKKLKNFENWKTHPIGLEIWREAFKNVKNEKNLLARKPNNEKNETQTLYDLEYCKKHWKRWKMRNILGRTWNMARVLKIMENEKHTLYDVKYGKKHWKTWKMRKTQCKTGIVARNTENGGKWEMHTVGPGIWREMTILENEKHTL